MSDHELQDRISALGVLRWAAVAGFADLATLHTWRSWVFGWLVRVLAQVLFYATFGQLVGTAEVMQYLLVGACVSIAMVESTMVVHTASWERRSGTFPLIVASPAEEWLVLFGRSLQWVVCATASSCAALLVLVPAFQVPVALWALALTLPLLALVAMTTYCFSLALVQLVLWRMGLRPLVGGSAWLLLSMFAGVYFPSSTFPVWLATVSHLLPGTNALLVVRALFGQEPLTGGTALLVLAEMAVGAGWLLVAALCARRLVGLGRRAGSIELTD